MSGAKRSWMDANLPSPRSVPATHQSHASVSPAQSHHSSSHYPSPKKVRVSLDDSNKSSARPNAHRTSSTGGGGDARLPGISRKVKACAACRKQKIKCIMVGDPPCQRCKERGLSCRLNKSLQTLMSEDSRWKASVTRDVTSLYSSVEQMLQLLNLPPMSQLHVSTQDPAMFFDQEEAGNGDDDEDQSPDNSPKVAPVTDNLSHVPIESLYQITGLRSLRASEGVTDDQRRICKQLRDTDFISRGMIKIEDAEYLATFYLNKLDPYIWFLGSDYTDLESFRSRSPTLTACVLTVAALHDTARSSLYPICSKEFRRLVANAMFERKIDMEYLRALVIGSYWLSDISWTLSGYAIRRASEFHFRQYYHIIAESVRNPGKDSQTQLQDAMVGIRVVYLLYVCDHHLSVLYGRSSIMRDNESYILGWESYLSCSLATDADRRVAGQISLMYLMNQIREGLGPEDTTSVLPSSAVDDIARFQVSLDEWISRFSRHNPSSLIGNWPNKGAIMHYHWAKLYLNAYVLRGLPENGATIPEHFLEIASAAVAAATAIVTLLLEDRDAHEALAYVPHHVHGMIAFACMFLLKVVTRHSEQLFLDRTHYKKLIGALSRQFKGTPVGKDHLIHRMAEGLEKMAEILDSAQRGKVIDKQGPIVLQQDTKPQTIMSVDPGALTNGKAGVGEYDNIDPAEFDFNDPALGLGMPFFDFEGTTLTPGDGMWSFSN